MLRVVGDDGALRTSRAGYLLSVEPDQIDARRFERLVGEAQRLADDPGLARERFEEALGLWLGQPLAGFEDVELVRREAERLEELRVVFIAGCPYQDLWWYRWSRVDRLGCRVVKWRAAAARAKMARLLL